MKKTHYAPAAELVAGIGSTAHQLIGAYRSSGEWLADVAAARWNKALKEASPKLTAETRRNAAHAREVIGGYYSRGLALSASGAETVVDTLVGAAVAATQRASRFQRQTCAA